MIQSRIDIVDSNCVDTELLHEGSVTETIGAIAQRVSISGGTERVGTAWLIPEKSVSRAFPVLPIECATHATPMIWKRLFVTLLTKFAP